ncbi:hypothetical protein BDB01DRAFT_379068 [Pilobolus umbonatus]|nr:hypothetical protein BDB01DRAFT_379068 [Pilobolus umbonatus]
MSHLNKDGLDSISEGCFLVMPTKRKRSSSIKPTSKRKNTKQKNINYEFRDESDKELAYNGYQQLFNGREPVRSMLKRKELFEHSWDRMNDTINVDIYCNTM